MSAWPPPVCTTFATRWLPRRVRLLRTSTLAAIAAGLNAWRPVAARGVKLRVNGCDVIDDTYNANPDSVRAAIDLLAAAPAPRVLVLGDMGEVGVRGAEFHREVGAYARERGIDSLFAIGPLTRETAHAFGADAAHFDDIDALIAALRQSLQAARPC